MSEFEHKIRREACNHPELGDEEWRLFEEHFDVFPFDQVDEISTGFELGAGTGLWASLLTQIVGHVHLLDHRADKLEKAQQYCVGESYSFHTVGFQKFDMLERESMDFGIALESLHESPNLSTTLKELSSKLKVGAPFLIYLLYRPENSLKALLTAVRDKVSHIRTGQPGDTRYSRAQVQNLLESAGLVDVRFSSFGGFWTAVGVRS